MPSRDPRLTPRVGDVLIVGKGSRRMRVEVTQITDKRVTSVCAQPWAGSPIYAMPIGGSHSLTEWVKMVTNAEVGHANNRTEAK
jgi:FKBP-type peptidyl-prolyl cis-trans isomerase 2